MCVSVGRTFASLTTSGTGKIDGFKGFAMIILEFVGISLASVVVGVLIGLAASAVCPPSPLSPLYESWLFCAVCVPVPLQQLFKHTQLRKYPHKEIVILFMCAYSSYAIGEACYISGIMALFFCGIALSHYNWYVVPCLPPCARTRAYPSLRLSLRALSVRYNLSDASKVASAHIFKGFAMVRGWASVLLSCPGVMPCVPSPFLSQTTETLVFTFLGMNLFAGIYSTYAAAEYGVAHCLVLR